MSTSGRSPLRQQKSIPPSTGRQPRPRRSPPRLRVKTGCLTCRARRKKCDENQGVCLGCHRNGLACRWPDSQSRTKEEDINSGDSIRDALNSVEVASPVSEVLPSNSLVVHDRSSRSTTAQLSFWDPPTWVSPAFASPQAQNLWEYFITVFAPPLIRPHAHQGFSDHTYLVSLGLQHRWLMDAFLACSALRLSYDHKWLLPEALRYYSSAISKTRAMIDGGEMQGTEDWLIIMAIFLCLFERWQVGPSKAIAHLQGAGQLLALRRAKLGNTTQLTTPFHRLYAESVLYNTTTSVIFCDEFNQISHKKLWGQISSYFKSSPYPDASAIANSPVLGVSPKLYRLVLEISCLARHENWPSEDYDLSKIKAEMKHWLPLDDTAQAMTTWTRRLNTDGDLDYYDGAAKLYALAADLLLFKTLHPMANDNHPHVQKRVQQALIILKQGDPGEHYSHILTWPSFIFGCAAVHENDFNFLLHRLESTWQRSYLGDTLRAINILRMIWRRRNLPGCERGGVYGIDIFLKRDKSRSEFI